MNLLHNWPLKPCTYTEYHTITVSAPGDTCSDIGTSVLVNKISPAVMFNPCRRCQFLCANLVCLSNAKWFYFIKGKANESLHTITFNPFMWLLCNNFTFFSNTRFPLAPEWNDKLLWMKRLSLTLSLISGIVHYLTPFDLSYKSLLTPSSVILWYWL